MLSYVSIEGLNDGTALVVTDGTEEGSSEGFHDGSVEFVVVGDMVGRIDGVSDGKSDGKLVGMPVGSEVSGWGGFVGRPIGGIEMGANVPISCVIASSTDRQRVIRLPEIN